MFATPILEQRILAAYQTFEARRDRLLVFHKVQDQHLMYRLRLPQSSALPTYLFKHGEIEINRNGALNTSGAFCDVLSGYHDELGKVALKRLRTGVERGSRSPVRALPGVSRVLVSHFILILSISWAKFEYGKVYLTPTCYLFMASYLMTMAYPWSPLSLTMGRSQVTLKAGRGLTGRSL